MQHNPRSLTKALIAILSFAMLAVVSEGMCEVKVYEGTIDLPSYEFSGRQEEPALFNNSTVGKGYPFMVYQRPYKSNTPTPKSYNAVFIENEYLKLTYVPDFGGRVYSLYDKVNKREVFYKNDVLKFSGVNTKNAWLVGNIELTGPYDTHMLTMYGEPLWFHDVIRHEDGSAEIVMSEIDPYFRLKVNFSARLVPGLAAMQIKVFCYNPHESRRPYMFWVNAASDSDENSRFVYPMTRTIGHTTSEVADWPYYSGVDYSWIKNNKHMLGVFGIDVYDNFLGSYNYKKDYGTFRFADRREVLGMKTWTYGFGKRAERIMRGYTDNAGYYMEIQSGRHTWDGHYEWLEPHKIEGWDEWWFPVSGISGMTTTTRDISLDLDVNADPKAKKSSIHVGLSVRKELPDSRVVAKFSPSGRGESVIIDEAADLSPYKPFNKTVKDIKQDSSGLMQVQVSVYDNTGKQIFDYVRPDENPGRKQYTAFTRLIDRPTKMPDEMTIEELVFDAETKIKEMKTNAALDLLDRAFKIDPGYSLAHRILGVYLYTNGEIDSSLAHLSKVMERNPYDDEAFYYMALGKFEQGDTVSAERDLYYIPPISSLYSAREYLLGRLAFHRGKYDDATDKFESAVLSNGKNIDALTMLALVERKTGKKNEALANLEKALELDPTNRWALSEKYLAGGDAAVMAQLKNYLAYQSHEAIELSIPYRKLGMWDEALFTLKLVEEKVGDVYGRTPVYEYTIAHVLKKLGRMDEAGEYFAKGAQMSPVSDRYPFRSESLAPLDDAIIYNLNDYNARFLLGCLLYYLDKPKEAIYQWEFAARISPDDFTIHRTLGLAYGENGYDIDKAAEQLEIAVKLNPDHIRTFSDLSDMYARAGMFNKQADLLANALARSPKDDYLLESLLTSRLLSENYEGADSIISHHEFQERHRQYDLRDKYRFLRYGQGAVSLNDGNDKKALEYFQSALFPPTSLGADDFAYQAAPRAHYYIGLVLEKLGRTEEAKKSFERSCTGWQYLKGDRDSYNPDNFFMVLSLEKLGMNSEANQLAEAMTTFSTGEQESRHRRYRGDANYLLALSNKHKGDYVAARSLMLEAIKLEPDMLGPWFELRGDVPDSMPQQYLGLGQ